MPRRKRVNNGTIWMTRVYNLVERDPEIDRFQHLWRQESKEILNETGLAMLAGLSGSTVHNLFGGKTRRPQHATFAKLAAAMGFKYDLVRNEVPNYEAEVPKARAEFKQYRETLKKDKQRKTRT
jgi:hypothetical protein